MHEMYVYTHSGCYFLYIYIYIHISGVQLGTSTEVVVAWWRNHSHPLCRETSDINTIVCLPDEEDTMT